MKSKYLNETMKKAKQQNQPSQLQKQRDSNKLSYSFSQKIFKKSNPFSFANRHWNGDKTNHFPKQPINKDEETPSHNIKSALTYNLYESERKNKELLNLYKKFNQNKFSNCSSFTKSKKVNFDSNTKYQENFGTKLRPLSFHKQKQTVSHRNSFKEEQILERFLEIEKTLQCENQNLKQQNQYLLSKLRTNKQKHNLSLKQCKFKISKLQLKNKQLQNEKQQNKKLIEKLQKQKQSFKILPTVYSDEEDSQFKINNFSKIYQQFQDGIFQKLASSRMKKNQTNTFSEQNLLQDEQQFVEYPQSHFHPSDIADSEVWKIKDGNFNYSFHNMVQNKINNKLNPLNEKNSNILQFKGDVNDKKF